jgi:uncharacterized membrane protein
MAFYTMAGGIVGALLATVPGLIDYGSLTDSWVKRIAMAHMGVNLAIIGLFALNLWVRTQYPSNPTVAITLSTISVLLLGMTGWLGGELVYVHGVAVEPQHDIARKAREKKRRELKLCIV